MSKELSPFVEVAGLNKIWVANKSTLRCTAILLNSGGVCIYSPVLGLSDASTASLREIGEVEYLLAPNHYHHKGLAQFHNSFPNAKLVCSDLARPRLEKQSGQKFESLSELTSKLPIHIKLLQPEGLKTGEVWFDINTDGKRVLIVTDAFKGKGKPAGAFAETVELLRSFPSFGIRDRAVFLNWLTAEISSNKAQAIVPCHGAIAAGPTISTQAIELIRGLDK